MTSIYGRPIGTRSGMGPANAKVRLLFLHIPCFELNASEAKSVRYFGFLARYQFRSSFGAFINCGGMLSSFC